MRILKLLFVITAVLAMASCEPEYEKEYSWAYPVSGDWTVKAYVDGQEIYGPFEIKTYNSSLGQDSIWIDDYATTGSNGNFWSFKIKAAVNMTSKTFSSTGSTSIISGYPVVVKVTDGIVVNNDSISVGLEFDDDPGTVYTLAGHRTTSYEEYMGH
jgi:hypothetical protein